MGRGSALPGETATYPPNELTSIPPSVPPTPPLAASNNGVNHHRKQTLITLLNALTELSKNEDMIGGSGELLDTIQQPSFEDDKDVPTVDEHLQKVGAEAFHKFQKRITNLDRELRNFANAARQLGSSVGILSSAFHLRERLAQILYLFRENASDLFPRKIMKEPREALVNPAVRKLKKRSRDGAATQIVNTSAFEELELEHFPRQMKLFAVDVITFLDCLNEFPEFTDEAVNSSILSLEGDLKYWASCLRAYEGQFKYPAVQRYIHDLSAEMGDHLDSITSSLSIFIEVGVPTIRFAQKHAAANLLNLSTVATFFSAVTATTLQFSFDKTGDPLSDSVNAFWFTSLVFSIGAAVNSLLGLTWKQAMYRSPGHRVPWWVLIWIKRSPLVFLVLSVACFSIGLVLFAYSSNQHKITSTVTTVFSAFSCFGLAAVSTWFASERWIYNQHKGTKWLADALSETRIQLYSVPGIAWFFHQPRAAAHKVMYWGRRRSSDAGDFFTGICNSTLEVFRVRRSNSASDEDEREKNESIASPVPQSFSPEPMSPTSPYGRPSDTMTTLPTIAESTTLDGHEQRTSLSDAGSIEGSATGKRRLKDAVKSVMMMSRTTNAAAFGKSPQRQRTVSSDGTRSRKQTEPPALLKSSRVAALVPKLKSLETTLDLAAHSALVRHLQFSPNGKFLATSSWDRTSVIFRVGNPFTSHRVLAHPQGFVGQVAWSPNGTILLTKLLRGVKLWTEDGVCKKTIDRKRSVHSVAWLPGGEAFLSVENEHVTKLDLNGQTLDTYHFERMIVHDVAVTQDSHRMLVVGTLTASQDGLHPSKSRAEKQIIVYNLDKKEIENRVPVIHEVRDITLARNDQVALVSYENKAPPQLWKLENLKEGSRLSLRHTYMPKVSVDFAGPSYFGGKNDQLILCAGKAGDIHIWDRESAALLHHVRAQVLGGDLTCIAWNHAQDAFMFATGSHDGAVRIWTTPTHEDAGSGIHYLNIDDVASSRATTNPNPTPRSTTPLPVDDYRSDSPTPQLMDSPAAQLTFHLTESQDSRQGTPSRQQSTDSGPIMYRDRDRGGRSVTFN
ncbi:WD40 repeat-like protein [Cristinia sonorae]|uniref:WD40 repeat-like protein n=1 Tax=Cristinia sonorae TaxID=1940300 RepID=A0A8K0XRX2_9AGAR|nr:WD40 repeat-like protein [Cristinia sonorae]